MLRKERTIETFIHEETLNDMIASFLHGAGFVMEQEEIVTIKIGNPDDKGLRNLSYTFIEERPAQVIVHK